MNKIGRPSLMKNKSGRKGLKKKIYDLPPSERQKDARAAGFLRLRESNRKRRKALAAGTAPETERFPTDNTRREKSPITLARVPSMEREIGDEQVD